MGRLRPSQPCDGRPLGWIQRQDHLVEAIGICEQLMLSCFHGHAVCRDRYLRWWGQQGCDSGSG